MRHSDHAMALDAKFSMAMTLWSPIAARLQVDSIVSG